MWKFARSWLPGFVLVGGLGALFYTVSPEGMQYVTTAIGAATGAAIAGVWYGTSFDVSVLQDSVEETREERSRLRARIEREPEPDVLDTARLLLTDL